MFKITLPAYQRTADGNIQVKLWINGTKRCLQLKPAISKNAPTDHIFAKAIEQLYADSPVLRNPCYEVYHLSGWCPECLLMDEITNKENLWERLT